MPKRKASERYASNKKARLSKNVTVPRRLFNRTTTTVLTRGPVAPRTITKLKYATGYVNTNPAIDVVFNLNSIFDPEHSATGHQPYGHDTYELLYNRYRVYRTDAIISFAGGTTEVVRCGVVANNTNSSYTNGNLAFESPNAQSTVLVGAATTKVFKFSYHLPTITGQTTQQYKAEDRYMALFGASPSEQICLHVLVTSPDGTTAPTGSIVGISLTLVFHVEMWDPKELGQS